MNSVAETISLLVVGDDEHIRIPDLQHLSEVLDVGPSPISALVAAAAAAAVPYRHIPSVGAAGHQANVGISLANGTWIVALSGREDMRDGWAVGLLPYLRQTSSCVLELKGSTPQRQSVLAIRRQAFAYGALDGRHVQVTGAMIHWLHDIFPQHRHRTLSCEGVEQIDYEWLREGAAESDTLPDERTRTSTSSGEHYDTRRFWEDGGRGWVKWEAFQPDEAEIEAIVQRIHPNRVLELGCGAGRNSRYFASAGIYAGLDISMPLLQRAIDRRAGNSLGDICGDVVHLPFADASFDLVFAVSTIQHVTPDAIKRCLTDIARVSSRYICLIEFVDELDDRGTWFSQKHMFRHDYEVLMRDLAALIWSAPATLQVQPAIKKVFLFEKRD